MKKLSLFLCGALLTVGVAASVGPIVATNATETTPQEDLSALVNKYIGLDGKYTKKTTIGLNDASVTEMAECFHANQTAKERTTYYAPDKLLLASKDGTIPKGSGSYYLKDGYIRRSANTEEVTEDAEIWEHLDEGYVAYSEAATKLEDKFVSLNTFTAANYFKDWVKDDDVYRLNINEVGEPSEEKGQTWKDFLFFCAPMLYTSSGTYFCAKDLTVREVTNIKDVTYLELTLHLADSDAEGKYDGHGYLAQARVYQGNTVFTESAPKPSPKKAIAAIENMESATSMTTLPTFNSVLTTKNARNVVNEYLAQEGAKTSEITNYDDLISNENAISYISDLAYDTTIKHGGRDTFYSNSISTSTVNDEQYGKVAAVTLPSGLALYSGFWINAVPFVGITKSVKIAIKATCDMTFCFYSTADGKTNTYMNNPTSATANTWKEVTFTASEVNTLATNSARYNSFYFQTKTALPEDAVIEFTSFYEYDYSILNGYSFNQNRNHYEFDKTRIAVKDNVDLSGNVWMTRKSWTRSDCFYNASGSDLSFAELQKSAGQYYLGGYSGTNQDSEIFTDYQAADSVIIPVYCNEVVDIKTSKFGGLLYPADVNNSVLVETKLYKGWNMLHLSADGITALHALETAPKAYFLALIPDGWSSTLEIRMTGIFYTKAAE